VLVLAVPVLVAFAVSCGYLGLAAYRREISLGTLAVMLPMLAATTPLGDISWDDVALSWMIQGLPRVRELEASLRPAGPDLPGALPAAGLPVSEVRFDQVRFRYPGADRWVFDGLDLVLRAGQSTALVGINGAGKTTLVKLLARLHDPVCSTGRGVAKAGRGRCGRGGDIGCGARRRRLEGIAGDLRQTDASR